jgi:hypothetical protein
MSQCAQPAYKSLGKHSCSGCGLELYCGSNCQKSDWKTHKSLCPLLKKLSKNFQPFREANRVINKMLSANNVSNARVLEHLMSFADFQSGSEIIGIGFRRRGDGQRISNWEVDINILLSINSILRYLWFE